jgi:hypothetical protein
MNAVRIALAVSLMAVVFAPQPRAAEQPNYKILNRSKCRTGLSIMPITIRAPAISIWRAQIRPR